MPFDIGIIVTLGISAVSLIVWLVRLEGRINSEKELRYALQERINSFEQRIYSILDRIERKIEERSDK